MSGNDLEKWLAKFPGSEHLPFKLRPATLYSINDLYDTYNPTDPSSWAGTYDFRTYNWFFDTTVGKPRKLSIVEAMAARLHDAAIEHSIDDFLRAANTKAVGFMGGHDVARTHGAYVQVVHMARALRRAGLLVVTGGGPGLMEAANLGAFLAPYDDDRLNRALLTLKQIPDAGGKNADGWIRTAVEVRGDLLGHWRATASPESASLGIPTWLYGHEPPNLFATAVGKYFFNSVREDGLINVASGGIVFGPGAAGTVQEVFQDATLNYYTFNKYKATPMVFLGRDFWDPARFDGAAPKPLDENRKPVFPLVQSLARKGHPSFENLLLLSDDPDEIIAFLLRTETELKAASDLRLADIRLAMTASP
jgi:predicted Rossmann-fold nucleotide-binding protein